MWQKRWNYWTRHFLNCMIKMLMALTDKINIQEQMSNVSREMESENKIKTFIFHLN